MAKKTRRAHGCSQISSGRRFPAVHTAVAAVGTRRGLKLFFYLSVKKNIPIKKIFVFLPFEI